MYTVWDRIIQIGYDFFPCVLHVNGTTLYWFYVFLSTWGSRGIDFFTLKEFFGACFCTNWITPICSILFDLLLNKFLRGSFVISLSSCILQQLSTVTLHFPAILPEFSSSFWRHAEVVSWTAGERGSFTFLTWIVLSFQLHYFWACWCFARQFVGVQFVLRHSHWTDYTISYIQIDCIQIGINQIMDYGSLNKSLLELAEKSTV